MSSPPRVLALAALACATACSAYGWAARPGPAVTHELVAVRTVDVDASSGADAAYLTRTFVQSLHGAGVVGAAWTTSPPARGALTCDVVVNDAAEFGDALHVTASARCALDGRFVAERLGDVQVATTTTARLSYRARAAEAASNAALAAVATDIADHLAIEATP